MTTMKLTALAPNTQVGPAAASRKPAMAGPAKRATCRDRLLMATALSRSPRGTMVPIMAWNGGKLSVPRIPPRTARPASSPTVRVPVAQVVARTTARAPLSA